MKISFALVALISALSAKSALASVNVGDELQIRYLYPNTSTVVSSSEKTYQAAGASLAIPNGDATFLSGDRVLLNLTATGWPAASFDGLEISDLSDSSGFSGWSLQAGTLSNFNFYKSDGALFIHFLPQATTGTILIGTAIPEPSTWSLVLMGLAAVGGALRIRPSLAMAQPAVEVRG